MATYKRFEDLPMWQEARRLCKKVGVLTKKEQFKNDFRLTSQIKASAGSVMDNIAEGFERGSRLEFINHLSYSKGSTGETRSQLYRSFDFEYIGEDELNEMIKEYDMLAGSIANFIDYLNKIIIKGKKFEDRTAT